MPLLERPDTARISWEADGPDDGPAVLLIMGLAYPAAMWFRLMPALTERYRVIRVDNRGAGHTGDVPGAPYTVETMAADCLAVLDAAEVTTAHVVGISMGGLMAQEIALTAPERVRSLCLIATHPGIAHAVMNPEAMAMLGKRGELTPQEAAEASIPFNYAALDPARAHRGGLGGAVATRRHERGVPGPGSPARRSGTGMTASMESPPPRWWCTESSTRSSRRRTAASSPSAFPEPSS